jgi:hypothetical protein
LKPAALPLEGDSPTWVLVRAYAQARIDILTAICTAPAATDQARRDAAMRIDELRQLLDAPQASKRAAPAGSTSGSY